MTLSISPRVEDPGYRSISFADLAAAYEEQIDALIEGGVDLLLIETIFDTLNAKAAIVAARRSLGRAGKQLPLMISGTITDRSGRTLSGQTPAAFWQSIRHAQPLTVGLNCALGAEEMRPHIEEISAVADTLLCVYPNAGLPNELGDYDEGPDTTAGFIKRVRRGRPRQHRRRVLWHHAAAHRRDRRRRSSGSRRGSCRRARRGSNCPVSSRSP